MPFITFEGIDGSGKTTQIELLQNRLVEQGLAPTVLREPGGTDVSERVRTLLLDKALRMSPFTELLLFSAARSELCREKIAPLLAEGKIVICDRFFDSTVAYQGGGRQVGEFEWLTDFNLRVTGGLVPDRTYLLMVPDATARARRLGREDDRLESAGNDFFSRVQETYQKIADREPERLEVMDGSLPPHVIAERIWSDVQALLSEP